jgi:hypothetical protein
MCADVSGQPIPIFVWTSRPLKMGPIGYPETSARHYHTTLRNIPDERRSLTDLIFITFLYNLFVTPTGLPNLLQKKRTFWNIVNFLYNALDVCKKLSTSHTVKHTSPSSILRSWADLHLNWEVPRQSNNRLRSHSFPKSSHFRILRLYSYYSCGIHGKWEVHADSSRNPQSNFRYAVAYCFTRKHHPSSRISQAPKWARATVNLVP